MPRYLTIGYGDQSGYDRTPPSVRDEAHAADAAQVAKGAIIGVAGKPVQVRNPEATGVVSAAGQFMKADLPVAGFGIIEASSMEEAIALAAKTPRAVAHEVVEVWPLEMLD
ncbi:YciI family protein [Devosia aurantiaca]|uniref:Transcription initiation protein n=1 Tax=Devosia aurantiaca TaxID=2714858 RepID=A0A6M1SIZ0_9HYPH|nr:YciI family protein [Devosia aurantiaca]NGP16496.1 transcription initiation protein [Devosia aurantiaca]